MIRIEKLTQSYCLNDINCTIPSGKLIGIMGANGAGKSTLLKTIAGILPLKQGEIWFDDQPLSKMNAPEKSRYIAYLAQNTQIHWDLSVYDVIALGLAAPLPKEKEQSKIQAFSEKFAVTHLLDKECFFFIEICTMNPNSSDSGWLLKAGESSTSPRLSYP